MLGSAHGSKALQRCSVAGRTIIGSQALRAVQVDGHRAAVVPVVGTGLLPAGVRRVIDLVVEADQCLMATVAAHKGEGAGGRQRVSRSRLPCQEHRAGLAR
jgi:hypothetical protein